MLSTSEIKRFIDEDMASEKKQMAKIGENYYYGLHDILKSRLFYWNTDGNLVEDKARSNIKIPHPFFTELVDQLAAYMLSFKENPIRAKEKAEGLQDYLDMYCDDEFWSEISDLVAGANAKGFEYVYGFKSAENRMTFRCADSMGVVEVREKDTDDGCAYFIYWYVDRIDKGRKVIKRIQVWSETETAFFVQAGNGKIQIDDSAKVNPRPHVVFTDEKTGKRMGYGLGFIPFWRLDNNKKQFSGLKPVKALIDDYDMMMCGLSNNLTDFDTPLHVVSGFMGDNLDELQQNLKTKKIIGVDEGGGVEVKTVDIPYEARKAKADEDEKNIYRFGMGLNTFGLKDTTATTNMAIRAAYTLLELKASKLEKRLRKLLKDILKVIIAEINQENGTDFTLADIEFDFSRDIMTNETENISNDKIKAETKQIEVNTILNVAANIGDEATLKAICEVLDLDFDELKDQVEKMQEEKNTADAKAMLDNVVPEEDTSDAEASPKQVEEAEETIGKPLNGAQTSSLLSIIGQYKAGQLDAEEAVAILAIAIGISEQKARKLLKLQNKEDV